MHLVPAPGWDAPGTRLPSTDIHQRGEPRLTGKLHLLTGSKAESRWGKGILQLRIKGETGRPQRHCGVLTRQGTGLCPRCFRKDHGSPWTGMWDQACEHEASGWGEGVALLPLALPGPWSSSWHPKTAHFPSKRGCLIRKGIIAAVHGVSVRSREARAGVGGVAQWIERLPSAGFHLSTV